MDMTSSGVGLFAIAIFLIAYLLVMAEEFTHLRKSKPVILAAGIIWGAIAWVAAQQGLSVEAEHAVRHNLLDDAEHDVEMGSPVAYDVFAPVARAEWDTLLFFYGVVLCAGGLGFMGYLNMASELMYTGWGGDLCKHRGWSTLCNC